MGIGLVYESSKTDDAELPKASTNVEMSTSNAPSHAEIDLPFSQLLRRKVYLSLAATSRDNSCIQANCANFALRLFTWRLRPVEPVDHATSTGKVHAKLLDLRNF